MTMEDDKKKIDDFVNIDDEKLDNVYAIFRSPIAFFGRKPARKAF